MKSDLNTSQNSRNASKCLFRILIAFLTSIITILTLIAILALFNISKDDKFLNLNDKFIDKKIIARKVELDDDKSGIYPLTFLLIAKGWRFFGIFTMLILSGLTAGLTIGLMSMDQTNLEILKRSGNKSESYYASKILPLRKDPYLLLCTLLVSNVIINETLPIFIDRIFARGWKAVIISSGLLLIFAEILPQAFFTKFGLVAGANLAWLVRIFIFLTFPISFPLSKMVIYLIGKQDNYSYKREQLRELVNRHMSSQFSPEEIRMITGIIDMKNKSIKNLMIPIKNAFILNSEEIIDDKMLKLIFSFGYSRIPLYMGDKTNIIGIFLTRNLLDINRVFGKKLIDVSFRSIYTLNYDCPVFEAFSKMKNGQNGHMAIVINQKMKAIGIIALEDIIEEILQDQIIDETDSYRNENYLAPPRFDENIFSSFLSSKLNPNNIHRSP